MNRVPKRRWLGAAGALLVTLSAVPASAQETGSVVGRVLDAATQEPLPGARVEVAGTPLSAATARDGSYRLPGLGAGTHKVSVSYLGYGDATAEVGKFNAGQKANAAFVAGMIPVMVATGVIMHWYDPLGIDITYRTGATFVHDWTAIATWLVVAARCACTRSSSPSCVRMRLSAMLASESCRSSTLSRATAKPSLASRVPLASSRRTPVANVAPDRFAPDKSTSRRS